LTTYGGANVDEASHISTTSNGGYLIVGSTNSYGPGVQSVFVNKTDSIKSFGNSVIIGIEKEKPHVAGVVLFPNPFSNSATIHLPGNIINPEIIVYDFKGADVSGSFYIKPA